MNQANRIDMHIAKEILVAVFLGALAVLMLPAALLGFVGHLIRLAFWPEGQQKNVSIFDGYEGWHV